MVGRLRAVPRRGPAAGRSRTRRRRRAAAGTATSTSRRSFYKNDKAIELYDNYVKFIVPQLQVEPDGDLGAGQRAARDDQHQARSTTGSTRRRGSSSRWRPASWCTTGSEGLTGSPVYAGVDPVKDHAERGDRLHLLSHVGGELGLGPQDDRSRPGYPKALDLAKKYVNKHAELAAKLGKPLLLEEFGFPRDGGSFDPGSPTTFRDQYFQEVYALVRVADPDHADGGDHALGLGGRQPAAAAGRVLEAGRSVHRRSAPREAGLVQHLRQGHDAEADRRVVAQNHCRGAGAGRGADRGASSWSDPAQVDPRREAAARRQRARRTCWPVTTGVSWR